VQPNHRPRIALRSIPATNVTFSLTLVSLSVTKQSGFYIPVDEGYIWC
jgi:hypothetical protein